MIPFLADENFNRNIVRGLLRRNSRADILTAQDAGLGSADDDAVLAWAAEHDRIILTHDAATMVGRAYERIERGGRVPGVVQVSARLPVAQAIEEVLLIMECCKPEDWEGVVRYIPL